MTIKARLQKLSRVLARIPHRTQVTILLVVACVIRLGYWSWIGKPIYGGDSGGYLSWARMLLESDSTGFMQFPLQQFYPVVLTPMYVFSIPEGEYIKYLHISLSTATVGLMYLAGRMLISSGYGLFVGALAACYPVFLYWLPYILTETVFLFCLSVYLVIFLSVLKHLTVGRFVAYLGASILLLFSRPVSLPILIVSATVLSICYLGSRLGWRKALIATVSFWLGLIIAIGVAFANNTELRTKVLTNPTVVQSLWRGTRISSSNMDETVKVEASARHYSQKDWENVVVDAQQFIIEHPWAYLGLAGKRFISFWYPWAFAGRWSVPHVLLDAFISISLTAGVAVLLCYREGQKIEIVALILMALSLAVLTSFSIIDTDGRYRLPAELILLIVSPYGGLQLLRSYPFPL